MRVRTDRSAKARISTVAEGNSISPEGGPPQQRTIQTKSAVNRLSLLPMPAWLCVPNVWPAPDLQVDFYDLVSISLRDRIA
jgi:hypothetical protein